MLPAEFEPKMQDPKEPPNTGRGSEAGTTLPRRASAPISWRGMGVAVLAIPLLLVSRVAAMVGSISGATTCGGSAQYVEGTAGVVVGCANDTFSINDITLAAGEAFKSMTVTITSNLEGTDVLSVDIAGGSGQGSKSRKKPGSMERRGVFVFCPHWDLEATNSYIYGYYRDS